MKSLRHFAGKYRECSSYVATALAIVVVMITCTGCGQDEDVDAPDGVDSDASAAQYVEASAEADIVVPSDWTSETRRVKVATPQGEQWKNITNPIGMEFVWIPPGEFMMGSPASEAPRDSDERQHRVTLTKEFFLGATEVTQAQWQAVMGNNPSRFNGDDLPVEMVTWHDAVEFCRKLSEKEGRNYRLPTEAEWEYACRAGTTTPFYFGNTISTDQANYNGNYTYGSGREGVYREKTMPAGSFPPNAFGLYHMHGNVWEWCSDWYGEYPAGVVTDPKGSATGQFRVLRGGSWRFNPRYCRSAYRNGDSPDSRYSFSGFRVCLDF